MFQYALFCVKVCFLTFIFPYFYLSIAHAFFDASKVSRETKVALSPEAVRSAVVPKLMLYSPWVIG